LEYDCKHLYSFAHFGQLKTHFAVGDNIGSNWGQFLAGKVLRTCRPIAFTLRHGVKNIMKLYNQKISMELFS